MFILRKTWRIYPIQECFMYFALSFRRRMFFSPFPSTAPYTVQFPTKTRLGINKELMINYTRRHYPKPSLSLSLFLSLCLSLSLSLNWIERISCIYKYKWIGYKLGTSSNNLKIMFKCTLGKKKKNIGTCTWHIINFLAMKWRYLFFIQRYRGKGDTFFYNMKKN